ncbi:hypothetical protein [Streptococcus parasuis]|uniref:hypothetical protein n=1 Tax=Streptococcus parasuis TaxID=1501662 RepID=UPI0028A7A891|nr:hypothetical protein [Streptococcus parasuis]
MMRIPKFRAWHKELKIVFEVKSLVFTLNLATIASKNDLVPSRTCSLDEIILMQFNGLRAIGYLSNQMVTVLGNMYKNQELVEE